MSQSSTGPLADIKVIELGSFIAGPYCGQLLADMGADLVKFEDPGKGDAMRQWGYAKKDGASVWWPVIGRNKQSITVDLRTPPGQEVLRRLIAENALVVLTTGSAQVPTVSLAALDDLCLTRIALETLATKLATERSTPADRKAFRHLVEEHEAAANDRNLEDMMVRNQELHFAIYECCGSPVITQFIQSLWLRFGPYMRMLSGHIEPVLVSGKYQPSSHHRDLIEAMDVGDARGAAKAIKGDIETTQALLRRLCKEAVETS